MKDLEKLLSLGSSSSSSSYSSSSSWSRPSSSSRQERRKSSDVRTPVDWPHPHTSQPPEAPSFSDRTCSSQEVHKPESRRATSRREGEVDMPWVEEGAEGEEQQKRRRGTGRSHLERTVSVRLVDIRASDCNSLRSLGGPTAPRRSSIGGGGPHSPGRPAGGTVKGWGRFRIPRRGGVEGQSGRVQREAGSVEPCLKRCHSHQLRGDTTLAVRRYGPTDIIRRGVLAS